MPSVRDYQAWNRFTYILRVGKCHQTISMRTCSHETGSLTNWEQANATRPSARGPAAMKQVHLHAESRQMPQDHQQEDLQPWNRFTYFLRAGKCHMTISKRTCSYETCSLTLWEQAHIKWSDRESPALYHIITYILVSRKCQWHSANLISIIADHLPPTGRIHIFQHQCTIDGVHDI